MVAIVAMHTHALVLCITLVSCVAAAIVDVRTGRIPDALTVGALGFGLGVSASQGAVALAWSILTVLAILALSLVSSTRIHIGGGDMKLLAAIGALLGVLSALATVVIALAIVQLLPPRISRPAAPAILAGVVAVVIFDVVR